MLSMLAAFPQESARAIRLLAVNFGLPHDAVRNDGLRPAAI